MRWRNCYSRNFDLNCDFLRHSVLTTSDFEFLQFLIIHLFPSLYFPANSDLHSASRSFQSQSQPQSNFLTTILSEKRGIRSLVTSTELKRKRRGNSLEPPCTEWEKGTDIKMGTGDWRDFPKKLTAKGKSAFFTLIFDCILCTLVRVWCHHLTLSRQILSRCGTKNSGSSNSHSFDMVFALNVSLLFCFFSMRENTFRLLLYFSFGGQHTWFSFFIFFFFP